MAPLVGEQYLIYCFIQGQSVQALWDSGSQVRIIDDLWKKVNLPDTRLRDISELLETSDTLDMPYVGWVEITFNLASGGAPTTEVIVPTLVMKGNIA